MAVEKSHQIEWKNQKLDFICVKSECGIAIKLDGSEEYFKLESPLNMMNFARVFDDAGFSEYFNKLEWALACFEFDAIRASALKLDVETEMTKFVEAVKKVIGE